MLPKLAAAGWPAPASVAAPLTSKPVPGVEKTTPRGEFTLKKLAGSKFGAAEAPGTPSQLISRRSVPKLPFAPAVVPPPTPTRKASRGGVIPAAVTAVPETTIAAAYENPAVTQIKPKNFID